MTPTYVSPRAFELARRAQASGLCQDLPNGRRVWMPGFTPYELLRAENLERLCVRS